MNGAPQQGFGYRAKRTFTRVMVTALVLGMGGVVVVLLSQLNARTFTLDLSNGQLVVMKGRMMPAGAVPYRPGEAGLADTYAPIPVENHDVSALLTQRFSEREELDRALFQLLEALARPRIASDEPERIERGVYYLRRAERLTGLSAEQRTTLKSLQAEVAYYQARQKMEDARKLISEALAQLRLAAESNNRHSRSANQMLTVVSPATTALEAALRAAVHSLSAPRAAPEPSPAVQDPTPTPPTPDVGDVGDEGPLSPGQPLAPDAGAPTP
ncbi:hypothetical protein [Stigmatella aurantiaca]|uniref:Conserved uncharacterized protein n=1 Tax=Stigmatella aurantiaca (strain DW4/3-1) TaxID=378806 RepID=E3FXI6_STIAD|nr:hypothetical protein [Stigmatella aurantiaca]ADO73599.1 conserved uncharacterized protein [Stigmatella aurantiaca DW4/3-1]